jgi:hypothetical protein
MAKNNTAASDFDGAGSAGAGVERGGGAEGRRGGGTRGEGIARSPADPILSSHCRGKPPGGAT